MATSAPSIAAFPSFPKLPPELRLKVWKGTVLPRIVSMSYSPSRGFFCAMTLPATFSVNKDSRTAVLGYYRLAFGSTLWQAPQTYVNFNMDTVYLVEDLRGAIPLFFSSLTKNKILNFRYLAIDEDPVGINGVERDFDQVLRTAVEDLPNLEELLAVEDVERWTSFDDGEVLSWHTFNSHDPSLTRFLFEYSPQLLDKEVKIIDRFGLSPRGDLARCMEEWKGMRAVVPALAWADNVELRSSIERFSPIRPFWI